MTCGTVVLLSGMMCNERLFTYQAEGLRQEAQRSFEVIIPRLDSAESIQGLANKILAETPPSFALCGLSMGGIVAMEIVAQAPRRIERLALLDTNPLAETAEGGNETQPANCRCKKGRLRQSDGKR